MTEVAYVTDVEGRWEKLESFTTDNPLVSLRGDHLELAEGAVLVYGGDVCDRGPHARRLATTLLDARERHPGRVVLLAGNRDINKLRLVRELGGRPPPATPAEVERGPRAELLRFILSRTMNARDAFEHRRAELGGASDDDVVQSFLDDLAPDGPFTRYLLACRLAHVEAGTLFVHGGVTRENLGHLPGVEGRTGDVLAWVERLNAFYREQLEPFADPGRRRRALDDAPPWARIIAYQAPEPGTRLNQASVVYARPADETWNPVLPPPAVVAALRRAGIDRIAVGHTPSGDCPAVVRDGEGFELVLADNSYGRVEGGSVVLLGRDRTRVRGETVLDDGERVRVSLDEARDARGVLGQRDAATGRLVKARLARGDDCLLFRGLEGLRVEQTAAPEGAVARLRLGPAWPEGGSAL